MSEKYAIFGAYIYFPTLHVFGYSVSWSEDDKCFVAKSRLLAGCMAHGDTLDEAIENICIAIGNWIETAKSLGREIASPEVSV